MWLLPRVEVWPIAWQSCRKPGYGTIGCMWLLLGVEGREIWRSSMCPADNGDCGRWHLPALVLLFASALYLHVVMWWVQAPGAMQGARLAVLHGQIYCIGGFRGAQGASDSPGGGHAAIRKA